MQSPDTSMREEVELSIICVATFLPFCDTGYRALPEYSHSARRTPLGEVGARMSLAVREYLAF